MNEEELTKLFEQNCGIDEEEIEHERQDIKRQMQNVVRDLSNDDLKYLSSDTCTNAARRLFELASKIDQLALRKEQAKQFKQYQEFKENELQK